MTLHPPPGFAGGFLSEPGTVAPWATASGPFRALPRAVARPARIEDVVRVLDLATEQGSFVVPRGAGTGMPGGNVGRGIVLDLGNLNGIGPVDPVSQTITVGAGAVAASVDAAAAAAGLYLPPLPSSADRCTVGGMVGTNAAGARSFLHGAVREWVTGLEVVLADGSIHRVEVGGTPDELGIPLAWREMRGAGPGDGVEAPPRGWPPVRKNSSGYALDRLRGPDPALQLLVGSEGTLAIVVGVTLRLIPRPPDRGVLLCALPELDLLGEGTRLAVEHGAVACEFLGRRLLRLVEAAGHVVPGARSATEAILLFEVEGTGERVSEVMDDLAQGFGRLGISTLEARDPGERDRLWAIRHQASPLIQAMAERGLRSVQVVEDSVVPPPQLPAYLAGIEEILGSRGIDHVIFGHAGDGNAHVNPLVDLRVPATRALLHEVLDDTVALVRSLGGTLAGEHGDGRLRAPLLDAIWPGHLVDAFREVKSAFDPRGLLNPGVIIPLPGQGPLDDLLAGTDDASVS